MGHAIGNGALFNGTNRTPRVANSESQLRIAQMNARIQDARLEISKSRLNHARLLVRLTDLNNQVENRECQFGARVMPLAKG